MFTCLMSMLQNTGVVKLHISQTSHIFKFLLEGNRIRGSHAKGQLPNFIVASAWEQKDWKKSRKKTSENQLRNRKSGNNEGWHE